MLRTEVIHVTGNLQTQFVKTRLSFWLQWTLHYEGSQPKLWCILNKFCSYSFIQIPSLDIQLRIKIGSSKALRNRRLKIFTKYLNKWAWINQVDNPDTIFQENCIEFRRKSGMLNFWERTLAGGFEGPAPFSSGKTDAFPYLSKVGHGSPDFGSPMLQNKETQFNDTWIQECDFPNCYGNMLNLMLGSFEK